jgi:hypothetical protein
VSQGELATPDPIIVDQAALPTNLFLLDPANRDFLDPGRYHFWRHGRIFAIVLVTLLVVLVPVLIVLQNVGGFVRELQLVGSNDTVHGEIIDQRTVSSGAGGQAITYYLTYRFNPPNKNSVITREQLVSKATYQRLGKGANVDVRYVTANPEISALAGDSLDNTLQNSRYQMAGIGLIGTLLAGIFAIRQLTRVKEDFRLKRSGRLLIGHINKCTGRLKATSRSFDANNYGGAIRGNFIIDIYYRFRIPNGHEIRKREVRKRNDLINTPLPGPGTPLAVLYLDDKHYQVL